MTPWIDYDQHARSRPRDDLWGQVRRTLHGEPVGPEQIDLIVAETRARLDLGPSDRLLDLACGNGAMTARVDAGCAGSLGVDLSPYLIEVAQERFTSQARQFQTGDATAFTLLEPEPERFTRALCYGSLPYLDDVGAARMLRALARRFPWVERVVLGNLPDPARARTFYGARRLPNLLAARSDLGIWRSPEQVAALAGRGWTATASVMPAAFYGAHYRFDLLLVRA